MRTDKETAFNLRLRNKSYNEISKILDVPKSTLSFWFKDDDASKKIKKILERRAYLNTLKRVKKWVAGNKARWEKWREEARTEARKEFENLSKNPLFIAGMMLYWGEGDNKSKNHVRLTNTDPRMIKIFSKFLINIIKVPKDKIKVGLILYPDLLEEECVNFWSFAAGLPKLNFYKTQVIGSRHPTRRLSHGICMILANDGRLKEKFLTWIDLFGKKL